jgi:hypothetical protein
MSNAEPVAVETRPSTAMHSIGNIVEEGEEAEGELIPAPEEASAEIIEISKQNSVSDVEKYLEHHEKKFIGLQQTRKEQIQQWLIDKKNVLPSYYTCTKKEELLLTYTDNFNRQYTQIYPGRKELLLCPANEFGVNKFICTTIRPTQLPFKEVYDYRTCAAFVSEFITYEPLGICIFTYHLEPSHELPKKIVSPTYVLKLQSGNCFDMSILLVSLLRAVGYDAYVVSGYGSFNITTMNQTKTSSESLGVALSAANLPKEDVQPVKESNKYKVKAPRQLKSLFKAKQEEKQLQMLEKKELDSMAMLGAAKDVISN